MNGERSPYAEDAYRNYARTLRATFDSRKPEEPVEVRTAAGQLVLTVAWPAGAALGDNASPGVLFGRGVWIEAVDVARVEGDR